MIRPDLGLIRPDLGLNPGRLRVNPSGFRAKSNLEQYFKANAVHPATETSRRRRAILISVLRAEARDIFFDLCSPRSPSSKSFADLKSILKSHFAPKSLTIAECYRFHNCTQSESECVSDFLANLKKLACTCNFGGSFLTPYVIASCPSYATTAYKRNYWLVIIPFNKQQKLHLIMKQLNRMLPG